MSIWKLTFTTDGPTPPVLFDYEGPHCIPNANTPKRGHIDCSSCEEPFLRLNVTGFDRSTSRNITQVLDKDTVKLLRDYLSTWLGS